VAFRAPRPLTVLAVALAIAACVALGDWQLGRAREKQALIDAFRRGDTLHIDVTSQRLDGLPRYQAVRARGAYLPQRQILLDNMISADGRPGYRVLTPFRRAHQDRLLLVDRGWVPLDPDREHPPPLGVGADTREIAGRVDRLPVPGLRLAPALRAAGQLPAAWPRVLNYPSAVDLAAVLEAPVEPDVVLLHPQAADGYERNWQPAVRLSPTRHIAYAIQWFAFAALAALVLLASSVRRRGPPGDTAR